jgi:hypothetical protein
MHRDPLLHQLTDLDTLSDRDLVTNVMNVLTSPPTAEADSFVLHAPLELMARAELLPSVDPSQRHEARRRIVQIASEWASRTPQVPTPTDRPIISLPEAIAAGDPDEADRALVDLATHQTIDQFVATAGNALLAHLGGAGHLAIFLDQLTRLQRAPHSVITSGRALIRDLARHPDWIINWIDTASPRTSRPATTLLDVLANPPSAGDPGNNFIYPTMHVVDADGMAAELLRVPTQSMPIDDARRQLLRVAAMSMLQDDPTNAPYGWSHCLTMPQATLAVAPRTTDPRRAIAIAATYVLGFRATQSDTPLDLDWKPTYTGGSGRLLDADCDDAVARAWHTETPHHVERELATYAATHPDAHLAKYTLACFHAAHADPDAAPLFRAAATRLAIWWRAVDTHGDPSQDDQASANIGWRA